jgi:large subunit ribosomal protein L5
MSQVKTFYSDEIVPKLVDQFRYKNVMQVPKLKKIILNMGLGEAIQNIKILDSAVSELSLIAGQKPVVTRARKSIAAFKLREGMPIGCKVTLRGSRMYDFFAREGVRRKGQLLSGDQGAHHISRDRLRQN